MKCFVRREQRAVEQLVRKILLCLLTILWLKLAYDLIFNFGPESARSWFPSYVVISMSGFSLFLALFNIYALAYGERCRPSLTLPKTRKALIVAAFLASIFSCWSADTPTKFVDMYIIIPAIVLLIIVSPDDDVSARTRYVLLILSALLLLPNDKCENPQNWWWINNVGASPLTYVLPVNVLLYLTTEAADRVIVKIASVVVVMYYAACVYHRLVGGY